MNSQPLLSRRFRVLIASCAVAAVIAAFSGLGLAIAALEQSISAGHRAATAATVAAGVSSSIRDLLLNGKTASAIAAKHDAHEIRLLVTELRFDHQQSASRDELIRGAIHQLESNLDATIAIDAQRTAQQVEQQQSGR